MTVDLPRIVFGVVIAAQAAILAAVQQDLFPRWTMWLALAGTFLQAFMASIGSGPTADRKFGRASPAAGKSLPPPLPAFIMAIMCSYTFATGCVKGASVQQDPNGGVDACIELAKKCQCPSTDGGLVDVGVWK